ncbi:MAG: flippase-like domain-containing protein [candidate division KSB1 bacterium]|nr:flippase-like domain-containing protein [candidate division KSB1 bacterium]MDZ7302060.1 flippase-like domain-containing protein [candidate division KSB1 bacterium]MDZ7311102.1 flippase-like domain-containing protein [candidate division KSB1 bacterium]
MRKRFILGLIISAVFIYLAFRKIDFVQMWEALKQVNYLWLFPCIGVMFISLWLRAVRWGYFMKPIKSGISVHKLFSAIMIGYYGNNVFPLRAGEVLRAYAIGKSAGVSRMASFGTIVVERLIDVFALLLLIGFSILFHKYPDWIEKWSIGIFVGTVVVTLFIVALMRHTQQTLRLTSRLTRPLPEKIRQFINKLLGSFLDGFTIFEKAEHFWSITWQTVLIWILCAAVNYTVLEAFSLNERLPIGASFVILAIVNFSIMLPSAPGYVGIFHFASQQALLLFNNPNAPLTDQISNSTALSFALILHVANFIPITLTGFIYFYREQLTLHEAVEDEKQEKPRAQVPSLQSETIRTNHNT